MKITPKKGILIAYGELFLKSEGVKKNFKRILSRNLLHFLKKKGLHIAYHGFRERIFVETREIKQAAAVIKKVFGIAWLADCYFFPNATLKDVARVIAEHYNEWITPTQTFAIRLRREKDIAGPSREKIINDIAAIIDRKVDLSSPKKEIFVEYKKYGWFLYFKKNKGSGGLPLGSGGKVLSLVSGGIDSLPAVFQIGRRGGENIWIHFHSFPLVSRVSIDKVRELANVFLEYQPYLKVYFMPFHKAQMEIKLKTPPSCRILLYRRLMLRIAEKIAEKENCKALVTGESFGQVSSQTLPNINVIEEAVKIPVLRPLIGMDKEEIIVLAKKIKTFQISIKPQEDCCTLFTPKHPTADGKIEDVKALEKKLKIREMVREIIKEAKVEKF